MQLASCSIAMRRLVVVLAAVALLGLGCGSDDESVEAGDPGAASSGAADQGGEEPIPVEPDPDAQAGGDIDQGPQPGDGIPFTQVVDSDISGPVTVEGTLLIDGGEARLCEALAESFPPQCGGRSIVIKGIDVALVPGLQSEGSVSWLDRPWTVVAELSADGGSMVVVQYVD